MDEFAFAAEALIGEAIGAQLDCFHRRPNRLGLTAAFAVVNVLIYWLFGLRIVYLMTDIERFAKRRDLPRMVDCDANVSSWAFSFDGIFIGATRTKTLRNTMFVAFATFLLIVFGPYAELNNHLLWVAFFIF